MDRELQMAAEEAAIHSVKGLWNGPAANINPNATLKSLGPHELRWIVCMAISQWIVERSRQTSELRGVEGLIKTFHGAEPEPWEKGSIVSVLPQLGQWVAENGLNDAPVGAWSRDQICEFLWIAYRAVDGARVARDELPGDIPFDEPEEARMLRAG